MASRWRGVLGLPLAFAAAAACSNSASSGPGFATPAAAVTGFFDGLQQNNVQKACSYIAPVQQQTCAQELGQAGAVTMTGFALGDTYTDGDRALVTAIVTEICFGGTDCQQNSNRRGGLPSSKSDFDAAFANAENSSTDPANQCVEIDGKWYVQL